MKRGRAILTAAGAVVLILAGAAFLKVEKPADGKESSAAVDEARLLTVSERERGSVKSGPRSWREELPQLQGMEELFGAGSEGRFKALQEFVERLPAGELPAVLKQLAELQGIKPTVCGRDLEARVLRRWADLDPRAAAGWAAEGRGENRGDLLGIAGSSWARVNFAAASEWSTRLEAEADRQRAVSGVAYEAIEKEPGKALELLRGLSADVERDRTMVMAVASWTVGAPVEAAAWAKQVPEEGLRQQCVSAVALAWAAREPGDAAELALGSLPHGKLQDHTVLSIARRWAMTQPVEATAWVEGFPEGELRKAALESIRVDRERMRGR
jgi:hypothetical protein